MLVRTLRNTLRPDAVTRVMLARNRICYEQQRDSSEAHLEDGENKYR